jgi:Mg-chelatase subunit ChlD
MFYPSEYDARLTSYSLTFEALNAKADIAVDRQGKREHVVTLNTQRPQYKNVPLDILFVFDTTGSMGEEIARLKKTIEIINMNIASLSTKPDVRFGMVLYKDKGDEYVTKIIPLTGDLEKFQKELALVTAGGGGDGPEDLQSALADAVKKIQWNTGGIRLAFIITDAEPHLDYGQQYTYVDAAHDAKKEAIKFYSIGTGGLPLAGEFVLRQISQYTQGRYIFLTYGERGESEGGKEGSVSHHTGANFQTDKLESIIIRFAKEELAHLTDQPLEEGQGYFDAKKVEDESNEETLQKLFDMAIAQLIDYSAINIQKGEPTAVLPVKTSDAALATNAEYFTEQLSMALGKNKVFTQVERKNLQQILNEIGLGQTGIVDEAGAAKAGKMLGAKMLITGTLYKKNANYEIFLKLIRVESAEVLSATKAIIDKNLGVAEGIKQPQPKQPVKKKTG